MAHLGIGGKSNPAPVEWTEFVLMDRFKKSRAEVQDWPLADGLQALTMMSAEAKANKPKHGRHTD